MEVENHGKPWKWSEMVIQGAMFCFHMISGRVHATFGSRMKNLSDSKWLRTTTKTISAPRYQYHVGPLVS